MDRKSLIWSSGYQIFKLVVVGWYRNWLSVHGLEKSFMSTLFGINIFLWDNGPGWLTVPHSLCRLFLADNVSLECSTLRRYWTGTPARLEYGTCQSTPAPLTVGHMWSVPLFLPLTLPTTYYPCHSLCIQHAVPALTLPLSSPLPLCLFPSKCTVLGSGQ